MSKATSDQAHYTQMFGQLSSERRKDNDLALVALGPVVSGLMLERHFETEILTEEGLRRILGRIFDALFPADRGEMPGS